MVERVQTKKKQVALKCNGKFICSSVDPLAEASKWVEKYKSQIIRHKQAVVLGVGCGYHLVALQKQFVGLNIIAIDTNHEFIKFCESEHALDLSNVTFLEIHNADQLNESRRLGKVLQNRYAILRFVPATQVDEKIYSKMTELLTGRTAEAAVFLSHIRKELSAILKLSSEAVLGNELISIKTLAGVANADTVDAAALLKIKILKEMIV